MADDIEDRAAPAGTSAGAETVAFHAASAAKADAYLDEQTRLARLQSENLIELNAFEMSHLRWRRFNDQMKGALQIMLVLVGALFVFAIGATLWSAAHDDGVVIEAFTVPPDMQARGLTGSVVSSMLLDRLTVLQLHIDSARAPSSYASKSNDIQVLIPDTGISISEAYRYLVGWLGHQTHISGDVYRSARGITVVVRTSGNPGVSFEGDESGLNALMQKAAEAVYRQTQPFRYAVHLMNYGRNAEADAVLSDLVDNGPASEKPWAYAVWMYPALAKGDLATAIARARAGAALDPHNLLAQVNVAQIEAVAGHDEEVLRFDNAAKSAFAAGGGDQIRPLALVSMEQTTNSNLAEETGDYMGAIAQYDQALKVQDFNGSRWSSAYMKSADLALLHDISASRRALGNYTDIQLPARSSVMSGWNQTSVDFPQFEQFIALGDWAAARKDIEQVAASPDARNTTRSNLWPRTSFIPRIALARAKTGDMKGAWAQIAKSPLDCYFCLRVRGQIAQVQKDWRASAQWFARAVALAPSIPFAYSEWGAMLMRRGDLDGAIAKFTIANRKGPHFADPLEIWGEALIAKNRSDLAIAKFAQADKYAPHWGRLHLKWGEALWWSGDKAAARKQFAIAAHFDLSPAEKSQRAKFVRG
jgi:tetratricopeptide (TPR) repeat protein